VLSIVPYGLMDAMQEKVVEQQNFKVFVENI